MLVQADNGVAPLRMRPICPGLGVFGVALTSPQLVSGAHGDFTDKPKVCQCHPTAIGASDVESALGVPGRGMSAVYSESTHRRCYRRDRFSNSFSQSRLSAEPHKKVSLLNEVCNDFCALFALKNRECSRFFETLRARLARVLRAHQTRGGGRPWISGRAGFDPHIVRPCRSGVCVWVAPCWGGTDKPSACQCSMPKALSLSVSCCQCLAGVGFP
jgi:hypothetical protein